MYKKKRTRVNQPNVRNKNKTTKPKQEWAKKRCPTLTSHIKSLCTRGVSYLVFSFTFATTVCISCDCISDILLFFLGKSCLLSVKTSVIFVVFVVYFVKAPTPITKIHHPSLVVHAGHFGSCCFYLVPGAQWFPSPVAHTFLCFLIHFNLVLSFLF